MRLGFVTSNKGKHKELQTRLSDLGYEVVQLSISYPELQADSIDEVTRFGLDWINRKINDKTIEIASIETVELIIIEDSGLFVHALNDFPGVYSKFVFNTIGYIGVLELLKNNLDRTAHFESCIGVLGLEAYTGANNGRSGKINTEISNTIQLVKGRCTGVISPTPRGNKGFGFDPIFIPEGATKTFAEMDTGEKNKYSHRGKAMEKFVEFLKKRY